MWRLAARNVCEKDIVKGQGGTAWPHAQIAAYAAAKNAWIHACILMKLHINVATESHLMTDLSSFVIKCKNSSDTNSNIHSRYPPYLHYAHRHPHFISTRLCFISFPTPTPTTTLLQHNRHRYMISLLPPPSIGSSSTQMIMK